MQVNGNMRRQNVSHPLITTAGDGRNVPPIAVIADNTGVGGITIGDAVRILDYDTVQASNTGCRL